MTPAMWANVPDSVVMDGLRLLEWLAERGLKAPSLAELESERARRGLVSTYAARRQADAHPKGTTA